MTSARCPRGLHVGHCDLIFLCSQMPPPPQKRHLDLIFLCSQIPPPPQKRHLDLCLPCSQIPHPPQKRHLDLFLPCSHLVCCLDFLQMSKHFMQYFVNCPLRSLNKEISKSFLHCVHCVFSIFINHQAHEKYHLVTIK